MGSFLAGGKLLLGLAAPVPVFEDAGYGKPHPVFSEAGLPC